MDEVLSLNQAIIDAAQSVNPIEKLNEAKKQAEEIFKSNNDDPEEHVEIHKYLKTIDGLLLQVTAAGKDVDCVSRSFAPKLNVLEDPVCGSGHCHIAPYWMNKLNKDSIVAYQASRRGGTLYCTKDGDRIKLSGKAALYSEADINIL